MPPDLTPTPPTLVPKPPTLVLCLNMCRCSKADSFFCFPEATQVEGPGLAPHSLRDRLLVAEVLSLHGQWRSRENGSRPGTPIDAGPAPPAGGGPAGAGGREGGEGQADPLWAAGVVSRLHRLGEVRVTKALLESSGSGKLIFRMGKAGGGSGGGQGRVEVADAARQVVEAWKARLRQA